MMQELGENIFWKCETDKLTIQQVIEGIRLTNEIICDKYLDSFIKNNTYHKILEKIGNIIEPNTDTFSIRKLKENTTNEEKDLIDLFIIEAKNAEIICQEEYALKDECKFSNPCIQFILKTKIFSNNNVKHIYLI